MTRRAYDDSADRRVTRELAHELHRGGLAGDSTFLVDPLVLFFELHDRHPEIVQRIEAYELRDAYYRVRDWCPGP